MAGPGLRASDFLDLSATLASSLFDPEGYPWLALPRISAFLASLLAEPPAGYRLVAPGILAGEGCSISGRAELLGPAVLGPGTEVRCGAFIRENVIVGARCVVGNSTELKNCILLDLAQAPHFNYVGDSVMGRRSHIGAGAILSNYKSDGSEVSARGPGGEVIPTGLCKFGAVLGDGAELGCNSVCFPGTLVGRGSTAYPLSSIRGWIRPGSILKQGGLLVLKEPRGTHG
ncbi:MAG TPA: UDP-N-acetylglucosamine pyrophosphorylase [Spirochaetia bacterium]|nr:UDP-N-acetylglucosamine pyrophosphorylase [Spirochaetia bacterium]HRZ65088.1 UDP-N-acetylglucosamine pyrophosphorylase [Spirochaetia bacterium]